MPVECNKLDPNTGVFEASLSNCYKSLALQKMPA